MNDRKTTKSKDQAADTTYEVIHILSDMNRMQILRLLADHGELCARDILSYFPITQPTLSHHMNVLLDNHLVEARKSGRWVFYHLSQRGIQEIIDFFETLKNTSYDPSAKVPQKLVSPPTNRTPGRNSSAKPAAPAAVRTGSADKPSDPFNTKKDKKKDKDKDKDKLTKKEKKKKKNKKK